MNYRQLHQQKIFRISFLGLFSLITWGAYLFISNNTVFEIKSSYIFRGLLATKVLGMIASAYLVLHELKIKIPFADKLCSFSSITDCDTILSSNASKLIGNITWADVGLIYFTGTLFYLAGINETSSYWILALTSVLALPYIFYSIYFQTIKVKILCPFCLIVQLILIAELILLLPYFPKVSISITDVFFIFVTFLIPATIYFIFKSYRNTLIKYRKVNDSYLKLKRNPEIFKFLLQNNKKENILITPYNLVFGEPVAPFIITAFLNLYCNPCATAFKHLISLLENNQEVKLRLVFSFGDDELSQRFVYMLYFLHNQKGQKQTIEFLKKWYTSSMPQKKTLCNVSLPEGFDIAKISRENNNLYYEYRVTATPTIYVNEYKYPQQYEYSDIEYYMDEFIKTTEEINSI